MDNPEQTPEERAEMERAQAFGRSLAQEISAHMGNRPVYIAADGKFVFVGADVKPGTAVEPGEDQNQPAEPSQSGKNAKKNRKEKERKARKKRLQNANSVSPEPDWQEAHEEVGERGDDGKELDIFAHHGDVPQEPAVFGAQGINPSSKLPEHDETFDPSSSLQAGEDLLAGKTIDATQNGSKMNQDPVNTLGNDNSPMANDKGVDNAATSAQQQPQQPASYESVTQPEDQSLEGRKSCTEATDDLQKLSTHPKPNLRISLPSSPPATAPGLTTTTTTRSSTRKTSSALMMPAVPFKLHFLKKASLAVQSKASDRLGSAKSQESEGIHSTALAIVGSSELNILADGQGMPPTAPVTTSTPAILPPHAPAAAASSELNIATDTQATPAPTEPSSESTVSADVQAASATTPSSAAPSTASPSATVTPSASPTAMSSQSLAPQTPGQVSSAAVSSPASAPEDAQAPTAQPLVQFDTYEWPCCKQDCRKLTSPYDGSTVICPRCGPYSKIRYCSKACLFDDLLLHWGVECGKFTLAQRADPTTITTGQVNIVPYIPSLSHHDRPERFRQFVRHSIDRSGDYFVFSDWADWCDERFPMPWPAHKHASGRVLVVLNFSETGSTIPSRVLFRRLVRICFLLGSARNDMSFYLFKMILGRLAELGLATDEVKNCLVWQFKHEFAYPGGFTDLLEDASSINWPLVAGQLVQLENQYRPFVSGGAGLGPEWTNRV
jgi:hypothetical protein